MSINMIRTTISRIKRVWAITFSPGVLRGDVRFTPGKFQILSSASDSRPPRRSKSSGSFKDRHRKPGTSEDKDVFEDYLSSDMRANEMKHGAPPLYKTSSACRCDECNKIIAEIFGEETRPGSKEHGLKGKLLNNIAQVNLSDDYDTDKYITDKAQLGLYQKHKKDDEHKGSESTNENIDRENSSGSKDPCKTVLCQEAVFMDKNEQKKRLDIDVHQLYTNLYDVHPEEYQCEIKDANKTAVSSDKVQNVDEYWKDVYETAVGENSVYCEPNVCIDEDTLNAYKSLKSDSLDARRMKPYPRDIEKKQEEHVLNASTGKQDDEKLIQKIEHIGETPLVEAEKSKLDSEKSSTEDSQRTPRVLGYVEKGEVLNNLDEVAKRCLTTPQNQIDEILLKEMEKLGIPLTMQKSNCGLKLGDNKFNKTDTSNAMKKIPTEVEVELDDNNMQNKPQRANQSAKTEFKGLDINPAKVDTQFHLDLNRTKMDDDFKNKEVKTKPAKKTYLFDVNKEKDTSWIYWRVNNPQKQEPKRPGTIEHEYYHNLSDRMFQKNQLDPKHVLTCNETCAISPKPLINKNEKTIEGTEIMYEQHYHRGDYMSQKPLLEENSGSYPPRTVDEPHYTMKPEYKIPKTNTAPQTASYAHQDPLTKDSYNITPPELPRREDDLASSEQTNLEAVDVEQLQLTTEQLQAASVQLHATCEHLQATSKQLQAATIQLQATSNNLYDSSDKLNAVSNHLYITTEKLQFTSDNLRDSSENLICDKQMLLNKMLSRPSSASSKQTWGTKDERENAAQKCQECFNKTQITSNETFIKNAINSNMNVPSSGTANIKPAAAELISKAFSYMKDTNTEITTAPPAKTKGLEKEKEKEVDKEKAEKIDDDGKDLEELERKHFSPNIEGWAQQATTINPAIPMTEDIPPIKPLPEINKDVKLSELMKIVRERNRLVDCHEATVLQKRKKPVPPLSQPMANPTKYDMPSLPEVKAIPRTCLPIRKKPSTKKFSKCNPEILGISQSASIIGRSDSQDYQVDHHETIELSLIEKGSITDLADDFILHLNFLGSVLERSYRRGKEEFFEAVVRAKTGHVAKIFRSQNYDPWAPIPSWPYTKKYKRPKLQCPKDGCKVPPPVCEEKRPCGLKPCETFPTFPKRTFSVLDCYPTTLSDHTVVDVGDF